MPSDKSWMGRVKDVEREHIASRFAVDHLLSVVRQDPTAIKGKVQIRELDRASDQLEGTYIIRLFAEFETILRMFWLASRSKYPPARTRDLLDGVGARCRIPHDRIQHAHDVRDYRNVLVHEREERIEAIPIHKARSHLCHFLSFLPRAW